MDDRDDSDQPSGDGATPAPGVEQLQQAALEAVQAARAVLDVAESMIREPAAVEALVNTVSAMARTATESVAGLAASMQQRASGAASDPSDRDDDDGYHRIQVD